MGKEPTNMKEEKLLYLDDILNTKPIEQIHPHSSIILECKLKQEDEDSDGDDGDIKNEAMIKKQPDNRIQIPNSKLYPYCCIGVITGKFGKYPFHGTGFLVASNVVLTCAHNLYDR